MLALDVLDDDQRDEFIRIVHDTAAGTSRSHRASAVAAIGGDVVRG